MNILKIRYTDALNGPGVRASIWVAGCSNKCEGCWAADTWNHNQGTPYKEIKEEIIKAVSNPDISGVSLLGGDPFFWAIQNPDPELLDLLVTIKEHLCKGKTVWSWTGYTIEFLSHNEYASKCLDYIDVLVDSKFDITKKDLTLKYRGSSNQRVLDVKSRSSIL